MGNQRRHHICFHGKADSESQISKTCKHTRRCTWHRGEPMPGCPSQWGCPVKSLGKPALLCFYTQVERWIWSYCEMCVQETQKCQYSMWSASNNNWQVENQDGQHGTRRPRALWNYFYKGVRQMTSSFLVPLVWALSYLVLYEPCPSLQASCSSLINISVFWLLVRLWLEENNASLINKVAKTYSKTR